MSHLQLEATYNKYEPNHMKLALNQLSYTKSFLYHVG